MSTTGLRPPAKDLITNTRERMCSITLCDRTVGAHGARGWCSHHYKRWLRNGDPLVVQYIRKDDRVRLLKKIVINDEGCWIHQSPPIPTGYRQDSLLGKSDLAHRVYYKIFVGEIPKGCHIDHACHTRENCSGGKSCRHRACVNPEHLKAVDPRLNKQRGWAAFGMRNPNTLRPKFRCGHEMVDSPEAAEILRQFDALAPNVRLSFVCRTCDGIRHTRRKEVQHNAA